MKLLIAIPALNEEESIEATIRRTLAARRCIMKNAPISEVEITVVSDGSTDRTVKIAKAFSQEINLIVFEDNQGYGAAIKEAWRRSDADILGFMDADGTCDPMFFVDMCNVLVRENADMVVGSRLHSNSRMPLSRRVGNRLFALLLSMLSTTYIRDTASGMRVLRRTCLSQLLPLPNGLHFTPAMSARAILGGNVRTVEVNMPYQERTGTSKLSVVKDGLRFLRIIIETAFLYRPSRPLTIFGVISLLLAIYLMSMPFFFYIQNGRVLEWMIYRFIVSNFLGLVGVLLVITGYLSTELVNLVLNRQHSSNSFIRSYFKSRFFWVIPTIFSLLGGWLVLPSFLQLVKTGATYEHWSRFIAMSFLLETSVILAMAKIMDYILGLIHAEVSAMRTLW